MFHSNGGAQSHGMAANTLMKYNPFGWAAGLPGSVVILMTVFLALLLPDSALSEAPARQLSGHVPAVLNSLKPVDRFPADTNLSLAIALPLRNKEALTNLLHELYDPASPKFRHFLSSGETTAMFGPTVEEFQRVIDFAESHGLTVTYQHENRMVLDVRGSVADIERAFKTTLRLYPHPTEPRNFRAPDVEPSVPAGVPIMDISGLDDYMPPRPMNLITKRNDDTNGVKSFATGTGPGGDFFGQDFRNAYAAGVPLTGVGQSIGLFEFGPYFTNDVFLYQQRAGLISSVVTNVLLDGVSGIPAPGADDGEEALDIDMAIAMAPDAVVIVYEGNSAIDIFNRMASDNKAKQLSCSWGFLPAPGSMDSVFQTFALHGQTMFVSAGDGGAYNSSQNIFAPADDPNITSVGGTGLTTSGTIGTWLSETTWIGSGGGISQNYTIPGFQAGMNWTTNQGSSTQRNFPDVSMLADTVIYWILKNGQTGTVGGTSAAAPLWAGYMALVNQQNVANGNPTIGSFNNIAYAIGNTNPAYGTLFHDITTGNNFNSGSPTKFAAIPGFDLATGWGSPNGSNMINYLATPTNLLHISPGIGFVANAPFGTPFSFTSNTFLLTNAGAVPINFSVGNTSVWLTVSLSSGTLTPGGGATSVIVSLNTNSTLNLPTGPNYVNVWFTNTTTGGVLSRLFNLNVPTANWPVAVSGFNSSVIVPNTSTTAHAGISAFDIPNNICFYQAGLNTNPGVSGSGGTQGLPVTGSFTSMLDGTTVFQFGPYGGPDALMMGDTFATTGTLTFTTPQSYNSLAILASSANGGGIGTLVLHFTNGATSQTFNFNAPDWFNTTANVAIQGFGRLDLGSGLQTENNGSANPNLYQTTLNLAALGLNQPIGSITFTKPAVGGTSTTGILGVSGSVMPPQVVISQQPQSTTNTSSSTPATFTVVAMGTPALGYQWYSGNPGSGVLLGGQTAASYTISSPTTNSAGNYFVVVSNSINVVTSAVATLTVYRAPVITQQPSPTNLFLFAGRTAVFSANGAGASPLNYYWTSNGTAISGATASTFALSNLKTNYSANYSLLLSNSLGTATSSVVTLTVVSLPISVYAQTVITDAPVAYYRLDESSGAIAHDFMNGNNGVYNSVTLGATGYNPNDPDKAATFGPAINSYVGSIPIDFSTSGNGLFSVEAWVKGNAQTTDAGIITKGTGGGGEQFNLDTGNGGSAHDFRFFVRDAAGGVHLANGTIAPNGAWHHVVGVCNETAGYVALYVDGVSNASSTITAGSGILSSANAVSVGSRQSGTTAYDAQFVGTLDEVAIYNVALTPAQISNHYTVRTNVIAPPFFNSNPFTKPAAVATLGYSGSIAANATDPGGNAMTFSKVSGPAWLSIASSGALSGTPAVGDIGTNSFVVRVVDTASQSNSATMLIPVQGLPTFPTNPFVEPQANVGQAYSGSISNSATDPDGSTLSYTKTSGPAWLNIALDGTLSGTPGSGDIGTNSFGVFASAPNGQGASATMLLNVNGAPSFITNPFSIPDVTAGQSISGTIATNATDPNPGDILTFAVVSGPAWLSVSGSGSLSGTPLTANVGPNSFVVSVTDSGSLSNTATLNFNVLAAPPIISMIAPQGANFVLSWTGGVGPYQVQSTTNISPTFWINLGAPTNGNSVIVAPTNTSAFYRIIGQ
jgi:hypothetical protein